MPRKGAVTVGSPKRSGSNKSNGRANGAAQEPNANGAAANNGLEPITLADGTQVGRHCRSLLACRMAIQLSLTTRQLHIVVGY